MKHEDPLTKAHKEQIEARLQQAKAKLDGLEATAKERKAHAEIETIKALRAKRDEIQERLQAFKAVGEAKTSQVKAEIETKVAAFEEEVSKLATKLKAHVTHA
jgi:cupin superfamily acireductone dioxygenase involved in methionine salvage